MAWEIARRYPVTGYVENLPDGRVRLVAEGPRSELDGLLCDVQHALRAYIRSEQAADGEFTGEFDGFRIRG
jgi:acylphosphatase